MATHRYNEELAKIIQELPHPGGMGALSSWRQILEAPPGQDSAAQAADMDSSSAGKGLVDWDAMHLACDPVSSTAQVRLRKCFPRHLQSSFDFRIWTCRRLLFVQAYVSVCVCVSVCMCVCVRVSVCLFVSV